jgi:hypothetical protein
MYIEESTDTDTDTETRRENPAGETKEIFCNLYERKCLASMRIANEMKELYSYRVRYDSTDGFYIVPALNL